MTDAPLPTDPPMMSDAADATGAAVSANSADAPLPYALPPVPLKVWGPWATIGWTALIMAVDFSAMIFIGVMLAIAAGGDPESLDQLLTDHGGLINLLGFCIVAPMTLLMVSVPVSLRRWRYADYVGLGRAHRRHYRNALIAIVAFIIAEGLLTHLIDHPTPSWLFDIWETCGSVVLLFFVIVIVAPVMEEIFFRGFLFRGLSGTRLGPALPIVVTAGVWSLLHVQYDWLIIGIIFLAGLLFGYVRHRSRSVRPTILMHMAMNLVACVQLAWMYA